MSETDRKLESTQRDPPPYVPNPAVTCRAAGVAGRALI